MMNERIEDILPREELLCQLAEEASELAQAALKLRRVTDGTNPTPVTYDNALGDVYEEAADVILCLQLCGIDISSSIVNNTIDRKIKRWQTRLGVRDD